MCLYEIPRCPLQQPRESRVADLLWEIFPISNANMACFTRCVHATRTQTLCPFITVEHKRSRYSATCETCADCVDLVRTLGWVGRNRDGCVDGMVRRGTLAKRLGSVNFLLERGLLASGVQQLRKQLNAEVGVHEQVSQPGRTARVTKLSVEAQPSKRRKIESTDSPSGNTLADAVQSPANDSHTNKPNQTLEVQLSEKQALYNTDRAKWLQEQARLQRTTAKQIQQIAILKQKNQDISAENQKLQVPQTAMKSKHKKLKVEILKLETEQKKVKDRLAGLKKMLGSDEE